MEVLEENSKPLLLGSKVVYIDTNNVVYGVISKIYDNGDADIATKDERGCDYVYRGAELKSLEHWSDYDNIGGLVIRKIDIGDRCFIIRDCRKVYGTVKLFEIDKAIYGVDFDDYSGIEYVDGEDLHVDEEIKDKPLNTMKKDKNNTVESVYRELLELYKAKNKAYGDSFAKSMDEWEEFGELTAGQQIKHKANRMVQLMKDRVRGVNNDFEGLDDTLLDMANYCVMTVVEIRKRNGGGI